VNNLAAQLLQHAKAGKPPNIALMHLLMAARDPGEAADAIHLALDADDPPSIEGLHAVARLWADHPDAWDKVHAVAVDHHVAAVSTDAALARWSALYDRLAGMSPEAAVAVYSLGSPELLKAATSEITNYLRRKGLLGHDRKLLEIGCGIGRLAEALAPEVGSIAGIDLSAEMIRQARQRCAGHRNVDFAHVSGRGLNGFKDTSFDLVLAVDVFPYMVQAGAEIVASNMAESARALKDRGTLAIFNFSYGCGDEQERLEVRRYADQSGFAIVENGTRPFTLWDGTSFLLAKGTSG
jgi:SAM-dependent methyltransferase